ncbi:MAG TPA: hypothetical protein VJ044_08790, partial [Candidatus Hodarchaeales archaeon]|nr:hypothetical protein [Candidatus Hodarchaeales archaeon]
SLIGKKVAGDSSPLFEFQPPFSSEFSPVSTFFVVSVFEKSVQVDSRCLTDRFFTSRIGKYPDTDSKIGNCEKISINGKKGELAFNSHMLLGFLVLTSVNEQENSIFIRTSWIRGRRLLIRRIDT